LGRKFDDMTGRIFNRLTVLRCVGKDRWDVNYLWECECECGSIVEVQSTSLRSGLTQSCGCLRDESVSKAQKEYNPPYIFKKNVVIGQASNSEDEFYFDKSLYELVINYCWNLDLSRGYMIAHNPETGKSMSLHSFVIENTIGNPLALDIHHDDENKRNNCLKNLILLTRGEHAKVHQERRRQRRKYK